MNQVCQIDTLFLTDRGVASIPPKCAAQNDSCDDNDNEENDSRVNEAQEDFDTEVESILSSLNTEEETEPPVDNKDTVDAALFLGLLKIIVDETSSEAEAKAKKTKTDYEELMALTMANESEMPEAAW